MTTVADSLEVLGQRLEAFVAGPGRQFIGVEDPVDDDRIAMNVVAGSRLSHDEELAKVGRLRDYQRALFDAGLAWIAGPVELGGEGASKDAEDWVRKQIARYAFPDNTLIRTGTQVLGPSLLSFGTESLRAEHLPRIHRGDELVCQLFSEPDAGSDLANIKTKAMRVDGGWSVSGQKVWSSGALFADFGVCIARTDEHSSRHAGLTALFMDMKAPGLEIRTIRQMTGGAEFCEVFFDDVFVPDDWVIGEIGGGWKVVIDVLMNERSSIGDELLPPRSYIDKLIYSNIADRSGLETRERLARLFVNYEAGRLLIKRLQQLSEGASGPGPELALTKLVVTNLGQEMSAAASVLFGPRLIADSGEPGAFAWSEFLLGVPGMRIGGGTDEVLKNGVAERILGLPRG